ncbi:medium-chain acyl-CoA ligase ACSF2, mitochondrial-like [Diorhabda sublineata]|uniref:medium-chain acyl-CoA ligase ACSF2, mitochondrial-like n=1 Tax=Diorhabda sublineata TaxID=1163346 RepID=UPI0024E0A40C|nr:medium-chain acyl-CoA ligase ACSF2, mitochondrial-like [Diorhabda sublineata]
MFRFSIVTLGGEYRLIRKFSTKKSYYHCVGEEPLSCLTLGQLSELTSKRYGDRLAVISCHQNKRLTFRDILDEADRLAAGFHKLGFKRGDRIGLWAPNLTEWYVSFIALARGGYVSVPMNPYYQAFEVELLIRKVGMRGLICGDIFRKQNFYDILTKFSPEIINSNPRKIYCEKVPSLRNIIVMTEDQKMGTFRYSDVLNMADECSISYINKNQDKIECDNVCNIQFTSGTTDNPKAPCQTHFNVVNNGYYTGKRIELNKKHHTICLQNPLFHVFGTVATVCSSINHGSTIVLPSDGYDPENNLTAITKEKCTVVYGTPTMYIDLINQQRKRNEKLYLEIAVSGGAPCSPKIVEDLLEILKVTKVKSIYGLTETTAAVFSSTENDNRERSINTVGKLQEHLEAKVINSDGYLVPAGVAGELCIRGYSTMLGYYGDEKKTNEIIDENQWLRTGDQVILTKDGYANIVGRIKDMIIRGGENIYPKEIEDFLITHPDILEVQVVGVPHERLGEEVCAFIKTKNNRTITTSDIFEFSKGKLSNFKIPSNVKIVDHFPTTTSGKVQKYKMINVFMKNKVVP